MDREQIKKMTDRDLSRTISMLLSERSERALSNADPETLAQKAMESGFTIMGDPIMPQDMGHGIVAITSMVKDTSAVKHRCHLYTLKESLDAVDEYWVWEDDSPSYLYSETSRVDKVRRTVSLHALADDAVIIQHSMVWDGERHDRKSVTGYTIHHITNQEGEIISTEVEMMPNIVAKKLPVPSSREEF